MRGTLRLGLLLLLLLGAGLTVSFLVVGGSRAPHDFAARCGMCHVSRPQPGEPGRFLRDIDQLCRGCHRMPPVNSHPTGIMPTMELPDGFPLDWQGRMTCATCHDPHSPRGWFLRAEQPGRRFCELCHRQLFTRGREHLGSGGMAHGGSQRGEDLRSYDRYLDVVSLECLECHDGLIARAVGYRIAGEELLLYRDRNLSHPIGLDYAESARRNRELRPPELLSPRIALHGGKVGCASCHNLFSRETKLLVMNDRGSALCLECHLR